MKLSGRKIAILIAPRGSEESEFSEPRKAVEAEGAETVVISLQLGKAETMKADLDPAGSHDIDAVFSQVTAEEFDALIIPGGTVGSDKLRASLYAVAFVSAFFRQSKPVAAICHAPWLIIEAGAARDRKLTSYPSLRTDIQNAGGDWVDEEVVVDRGLITSRSPDDLPAFTAKIIDILAG